MSKMQKKLKGIVVGCFSSTAKVRVYTLSKHRRYGKYISSWSGILVDIPAGLSVSVGQSVLIVGRVSGIDRP